MVQLKRMGLHTCNTNLHHFEEDEGIQSHEVKVTASTGLVLLITTSVVYGTLHC